MKTLRKCQIVSQLFTTWLTGYNMSGFEMKALQQTGFEMKLFSEIKIWWRFCVQNLFLISFHTRKNVNFVNFVLFWETWFSEKRIRKTYPTKRFRNESIFESIFQQSVRFWINLFTSFQILNWYSLLRQKLNWFLQRIRIWSDIVMHLNRFRRKFWFQKIFFGSFYSVKTSTSAVMCPLKNHDMEEKRIKSGSRMKPFEKNRILQQLFNNASDFESRFSNYVRV